jgi:hypothetical protein
MSIKNWMSWEGGVDLAAFTKPGLAMPNVIIHVARMVHTPIGSAPAGMILFQSDPAKNPEVMGFISSDEKIAAYFGPKIFAGTPFEHAPALKASIEVTTHLPGSVSAKVVVAGHTFVSTLSELAADGVINRAPAAMTPFVQQGVEAGAKKATLTHNGANVSITVPPVGIGGGPGAVWSACGVYAR